MKKIAKTLVAVIAISAFAQPAHAEITTTKPVVKKVVVKKTVKAKSIAAKKAKYLTAANLDATTPAAPAVPAVPATPVVPAAAPVDANSAMMAKLLDLFKTLMDSNAAALAALKQPANSIINTVSPTITVNPNIAPVQQTAVQSGAGSVALSNPGAPTISLGSHQEHDESHR
ncbi:MAG: hypothetical protein RL129_183 [Actinomycetota bacterium]|jgi:hypothetical protein